MKKDHKKMSLLSEEEKDIFFQALEDDQELFLETLEVLLTIVVSDPLLTFDVADLIEYDYRNLFLVLMKKVKAEIGKSNTLGCCKEL